MANHGRVSETLRGGDCYAVENKIRCILCAGHRDILLCLGYGLVLSAKGRELHQELFELIPGFVGGNPVSMVWGAVYMGILAWIAGWYIAWMHNTSILTVK